MTYKKCDKCGAETSSEEISLIIDGAIGDAEIVIAELAKQTGDELAAELALQLNALRRIQAGLRKDLYVKVKLNDALPSANMPFVEGLS